MRIQPCSISGWSMETIVDESVWQVRGFKNHDRDCQWTFGGPRAFNEATDWFDLMRSSEEMQELWLLRKDGCEWMFVERIRLNAEGQWESLPFDAQVE